jgi:RNA polymerase sigma-70 factor, ECF subfamily
VADPNGMECYWSNLYDQVGPALLAYFARRHRQAQLAEDLLQDTFVQAMKCPERVQQAASARAYLFGIARHLSQEACRQPDLELLPEVEAQSNHTSEPNPKLERMREAIHTLTPPHREVLELRLHQEFSYEEISSALGIPIGTVRSRLHSAVKQLREKMIRED